MQHMLSREDIGIVIGRAGQVVGDMPWNVCFISKSASDFNLFYRGGGVLFPLYLYPETNDLLATTPSDLWSATPSENGNYRTPNLNPSIVQQIATGLGLSFASEKITVRPELVEGQANHASTSSARTETTFAPIDLLDYIYAVLHSPSYRETYEEFLKIDFPRVPYPTDAAQFWQLVALGGELRKTHLLEAPSPPAPLPHGKRSVVSYPIAGNNVMDKLRYEAGRVYINETQYFENVPEIAWYFYIGGYQPAQKWLKDRKGRTLGFEDIAHYQKIIAVLSNTQRLMQEIDAVFSVN